MFEEEPISPVEIEIKRLAPFILISSVLNKPGVGAKICEVLASHNINIESFITVSVPGKERTDILIEVAQEDLDEANYLLSGVTEEIEAKGLLSPGINVEELTKVVVRGAKLSSQAGVGARVFKVFSKYGINVWALIVTSVGEQSEMKVLIEKRQLEEYPQIIDELKKSM